MYMAGREGRIMKKMGGEVPGSGLGWNRAGRKGDNHRVLTERQLPLSGEHSIMMEKLAQPGEGGECTPTPFHYINHHIQRCSVTL
jgi:hypothetical protein